MSIWTQVFLVNLVMFFTVAAIIKLFGATRYTYGDLVIGPDKWYDLPFGIWLFLTLISIPVWFIYWVVA